MKRELLFAMALSIGAHLVFFAIPWRPQNQENQHQSPPLEVILSLALPHSSPFQGEVHPSGNVMEAPSQPAHEEKILESQKASDHPLVHRAKKPEITKQRPSTRRKAPGAMLKEETHSHHSPPEPGLHNKTEVESSPQGQGDLQDKAEGINANARPGSIPQDIGHEEGRGEARAEARVTKALPKYDLNPRPPYPEIARRRGYQGTAVLLVRVMKDGSVGEVRLAQSSGYEILDRSALETVKTWRFFPAMVGHEPVEMEILVPIRFELQ